MVQHLARMKLVKKRVYGSFAELYTKKLITDIKKVLPLLTFKLERLYMLAFTAKSIILGVSRVLTALLRYAMNFLTNIRLDRKSMTETNSPANYLFRVNYNKCYTDS